MSVRQPLLGANTGYALDGNEYRSLQGDHSDDRIPLWLDDRAWVRIPARCVYSIWNVLSSPSTIATWLSQLWGRSGRSLLNLLLVSIPFAIVSKYQNWDDETVLALNLLALLPLENLTSATADAIAFQLGNTAEEIIGIIVPHIIPLLVSFTAISRGSIDSAQLYIVGTLIANILLGLGGSFLSSSFLHQESGFNETATITEASVLYSACVPIGMVGFISLAIGRDYPLLNVDMLMLEMYISHVASIVMIVLYAFYQLFKIRTHSFLWDTVEFGSDSENDDDVEYTRTVQASRLILLIVTLGGALACMWYCARNIFDISLVAELHHSRHFIVAILLPFTTHVSHYWKTYRATYTHSVDIAMGLTLATNAHIMLFDLPLLVLVGWAMQMPVTLNLGLTSTILLIICIYVSTHLIGNGKSNYLIGGMYIAMYTIVSLGYYLWTDD